MLRIPEQHVFRQTRPHGPQHRGRVSLPGTPPLRGGRAAVREPLVTDEETEAQGDFPLGLSGRVSMEALSTH